jgi:N-hydroxyarylamine O-acetyltransferase
MVLRVDLDQPWIADVGFGDSFIEPLRLVAGEQHDDSYRLIESASDWILQRKAPETDWTSQYAFSLTPRRFDEFGPMCDYQQTSPDSIFTRKSVCSIATPDGRITLSNGRLIVTDAGRREERVVESAAKYRALLATHFDMTLPIEAPVEKLL